jgi:hypothetical protein
MTQTLPTYSRSCAFQAFGRYSWKENMMVLFRIQSSIFYALLMEIFKNSASSGLTPEHRRLEQCLRPICFRRAVWWSCRGLARVYSYQLPVRLCSNRTRDDKGLYLQGSDIECVRLNTGDTGSLSGLMTVRLL